MKTQHTEAWLKRQHWYGQRKDNEGMKPKIKRIACIALAVVVMLVTAGCWDRIEINDRVFVLALAIDKYEPEQDGQDEQGNGQQESEQQNGGRQGVQQPEPSPRNRIVVSIVFPNVGLLKGEGAIVPEEPKIAVSTVAPNIFEAMRQFNTRFFGNIFFGHMKAVLVGEGILSDDKLFLEVLDELERDHEIARDVYFLAVKGNAKDALFIKPLVEPIVGVYIEQIIEQRKTGRFHGKDLGQITTSIREIGGAPVPRVIVGDKEIKIAGTGIIKNHRLTAWLGELETHAAQWIENTAGEDVISVELSGISVPFELTQLKRRMKVWRDEAGNIHLDIRLETEGNIEGHILEVHREVMDQGFIRQVEGAVSRHMTEQCLGLMRKMQKEIGLDVWGIGDHIRKFHPEIWDDVKDNWQQVFSEMIVDISTVVRVRRIGIIK
jgi:spore germination protein KC